MKFPAEYAFGKSAKVFAVCFVLGCDILILVGSIDNDCILIEADKLKYIDLLKWLLAEEGDIFLHFDENEFQRFELFIPCWN